MLATIYIVLIFPCATELISVPRVPNSAEMTKGIVGPVVDRSRSLHELVRVLKFRVSSVEKVLVLVDQVRPRHPRASIFLSHHTSSISPAATVVKALVSHLFPPVRLRNVITRRNQKIDL